MVACSRASMTSNDKAWHSYARNCQTQCDVCCALYTMQSDAVHCTLYTVLCVPVAFISLYILAGDNKMLTKHPRCHPGHLCLHSLLNLAQRRLLTQPFSHDDHTANLCLHECSQR